MLCCSTPCSSKAALQPPTADRLPPALDPSVSPSLPSQCVAEWGIDYFEEVLLPLDNFIRSASSEGGIERDGSAGQECTLLPAVLLQLAPEESPS